jgi:asparagine synthase (glutamine-hydrolysing)
MFAGDGGDELFGGNSRYAKQRIFGLYEKVPGLIKGALLEPALMQTPLGKLPLMRKAASYIEQARTPLPDRTAKYNLIYHLGIDNVFPSSFLSGIDPEARSNSSAASGKTSMLTRSSTECSASIGASPLQTTTSQK